MNVTSKVCNKTRNSKRRDFYKSIEEDDDLLLFYDDRDSCVSQKNGVKNKDLLGKCL